MTIDEIDEMIGGESKASPQDVSETDMIHGAMDLEDANVREVMRPLVDVVALKIPEATIAAALDLARATGYSRFPVFRRRIIEMTEYLDITPVLREGVYDGPLTPHVKPALIVPETMRIDRLLREFTEQHRQCALVVDEFGGVVGWVTREDVLEEIVGEIADKDTDTDPRWRLDEAGAYHVDARMDLDDLNEQIGSQLAKGDEYDTLGGWLYTLIGRIPRVGESVEADGVFATVTQMDGHRILVATIELLDEPRNGR
jgi:magnesium and cobalt transporter